MASHVGHQSRLAYIAICENEPIARVRYNCLMSMLHPITRPATKEEREKMGN
ncbi:Splicing factor 3B subunit, putative [Perkinsus marinus ATCC 50983]|nr:Splicing factor 3B subunit, putative [Perkinsus marinus ATCC 50983]EER04002.1 Splicing factor 3B subunit, putative [Perkinsus marinus ATCC 50983]|eukprot:XP_002772186.1 Splicing factor 3B subunit, putative [Perkinsus marinus ATCC 50983]